MSNYTTPIVVSPLSSPASVANSAKQSRLPVAALAIGLAALVVGLCVMVWMLVVTQAGGEIEGNLSVHGALSVGMVRQLGASEPLTPGHAVVVGADGVTLEPRARPHVAPVLHVEDGGAADAADGSTLAPFGSVREALRRLAAMTWQGTATVILRGRGLTVLADTRWDVPAGGDILLTSEKGMLPLATLDGAARLTQRRLRCAAKSQRALIAADFVDECTPFLAREGGRELEAVASIAEPELLMPSAELHLEGTLRIHLAPGAHFRVGKMLVYGGGDLQGALDATGEGELRLGPGSSLTMMRRLRLACAVAAITLSSLSQLRLRVEYGAEATLRSCALRQVQAEVLGASSTRMVNCLMDTPLIAHDQGTRLVLAHCSAEVEPIGDGKADISHHASVFAKQSAHAVFTELLKSI